MEGQDLISADLSINRIINGVLPEFKVSTKSGILNTKRYIMPGCWIQIIVSGICSMSQHN